MPSARTDGPASQTPGVRAYVVSVVAMSFIAGMHLIYGVEKAEQHDLTSIWLLTVFVFMTAATLWTLRRILKSVS